MEFYAMAALTTVILALFVAFTLHMRVLDDDTMLEFKTLFGIIILLVSILLIALTYRMWELL